ncbi:MAG: allantoinase AllB [Ferruginibacter sp.]
MSSFKLNGFFIKTKTTALIAIHSNKTVLPNGMQEAVVLVENGRILDVLPNLQNDEQVEWVEAGDCVLMPGVIDPHVHINEPGRTEWEGFDTATRAAIAGGITTLVDMPLNASPVTTTEAAFEKKIAAAQNKLHTNTGFWGGLIPGNEGEIERLVEKGVLGFKAFLTHSGIDEFPNVTEADLRKAMPLIAKHGLPLLVHCELTDNLQRSSDDVRSYNNYLQTRPAKWDDDAIQLMIQLCEEFECRVHIVHLSSASSIGQIKAAKDKGLPLTVETGQHYLYFNAEQIKDGQTQFKCAPPIREKENNERLWDALRSGIIDFVATDHSPATPVLKEMESGNFIKAWGGIASIQFALPVLWTEAKRRNCNFTDVVKWLCENPAKLIGKEKSKGKIEKGFDADLVIMDEQKMFTVTEGIIHHRHKITPYLNEQLYGVVQQTYLGGKKVYDNGNFLQLNGGEIVLNR